MGAWEGYRNEVKEEEKQRREREKDVSDSTWVPKPSRAGVFSVSGLALV